MDGSRESFTSSLVAGFRGRQLATASVSKAIASFCAEHADITTLIAYVKVDNPASCRVFEKLNFEEDGFDRKMQANRYHIDLDKRALREHTGND